MSQLYSVLTSSNILFYMRHVTCLIYFHLEYGWPGNYPFCIGFVKLKCFLKLVKPQSTAKDTDSEKPEQTGLSDDAKLRRANLNIEKWLKSKFREGFKDMLNAMKKYDNDDTGRINRKDFRHVLGQYGLHLR